jgi:hypothetical protein
VCVPIYFLSVCCSWFPPRAVLAWADVDSSPRSLALCIGTELGVWGSLMLRFPCVDFEFSITCGLLYVEAGLILSNRIKKLEVFGFLLFSRGGSRTCPPGVWWNACEDINYFSI